METAALASSILPIPVHDMWRYGDDTYIDRRLGFSLRPPAGWRFANVTPEAMRPIGTVVEWLSGERDVAACALWTGTDSEGTARVEQVLDLQIRRIFDAAEMADPERHPVQLAGRPAQKLVWIGDTTVVEAIILSDGPWTYWLVGSWLGNESATWFRDAVESFALVE